MSIPNAEDLKKMADQSVDLSEVSRAAEAAEAEAAKARAEVQRQEELQKRAASWDRNMTRAFKGIVPAPERRRQLRRAVEAANAAD